MGKGITKTGCFVCKIGSILLDNEIRLVDEYDLQHYNKLKEEENKGIEGKWYLKEKAKARIRKHIYTMAEYANPDIETDLVRFEYCPRCGQKIDWYRIGGMYDDSIP